MNRATLETLVVQYWECEADFIKVLLWACWLIQEMFRCNRDKWFLTFITLIAVRVKTKGHFKLTVILGEKQRSNTLTLDWTCEQPGLGMMGRKEGIHNKSLGF